MQSLSSIQLPPLSAFYDEYEILPEKQIGGKTLVRKCRHKATGAVRVCKEITCKNKQELQQLQMELSLHSQLQHPRIIQFFGAYKGTNSVYVLMEYANGGSAIDLICRFFRTGMPEKLAAKILFDVLAALDHCHGQGIAHRDIKPDNVLICIDERFVTDERSFAEAMKDKSFLDNVRFTAKLADFGYASQLHTESRPTFTQRVGTPQYVAPEVLLHQANYNLGCDVWSVGVMLYVLLTGRMPFYGHSNDDMYYQILQGKYSMPSELFGKVSSAATSIIKSSLRVYPFERPSVSAMLVHPWFGEVMPLPTVADIALDPMTDADYFPSTSISGDGAFSSITDGSSESVELFQTS